jgi:hypothetical protein
MPAKIIFDHADEISLRLSDLRDERKAAESALPADEQRQRFISGADPIELTPVLRSAPPLVEGGQGHTDADIDRAAKALRWLLAIAAGLGLGVTAARYVAAAADAIGAWCVS